MTRVALIALRGAGGEPVDLRRTLGSHGVAELPPMALDADGRGATVTLATPEGPRTVRLEAAAASVSGGAGPPSPRVAVDVADAGPPPAPPAAAALTAAVRRMLCLDDDLSGFYAAVRGRPGPRLGGAGRRPAPAQPDGLRGRGQDRLHDQLRLVGDGADGRRPGRPARRAGPGGAARRRRRPHLPDAGGDGFRRRRVLRRRRARRLPRRLPARDRPRVAGGELDLEELLAASRAELPDEEVERRLLELPGVGPYAAAHVMLLLGRHSRLVLDSWTRPKYARLMGKPEGQARRRQHDRPALPPLRRPRRARLLAGADPRLGGRLSGQGAGLGDAEPAMPQSFSITSSTTWAMRSPPSRERWMPSGARISTRSPFSSLRYSA